MADGTTPLVMVRGLAAGYGGRPIVSAVDFDITPGEIVALLGGNGAGKSTLLRALTGQIRLLAGTVTVCGHEVAATPERARSAMGIAVEPAELPQALTARQYIELVASIKRCAVDDWPDRDLLDRLALHRWLDEPIAACSLGTQGKIAIAGAMLGRPPILILDESLNGLDPVAAFEVKGILREIARAGGAVLISTHELAVVPSLCSSALLMDEGRLVARWDTPELAKARDFEHVVMQALRRDRYAS